MLPQQNVYKVKVVLCDAIFNYISVHQKNQNLSKLRSVIVFVLQITAHDALIFCYTLT